MKTKALTAAQVAERRARFWRSYHARALPEPDNAQRRALLLTLPARALRYEVVAPDTSLDHVRVWLGDEAWELWDEWPHVDEAQLAPVARALVEQLERMQR